MKTVFICHPIGGNITNNVKKILHLCRNLHDNNLIPVAPYLGSLQYLDDTKPESRQLGINANLETLRRGFVDELWLFGDRISPGMKEEVFLCFELGIPVYAHTSETLADLRYVLDSWKELRNK